MKRHRLHVAVVIIIAVFGLLAPILLASDTIEGRVMIVGSTKLTVMADGIHSFTVASRAKITRDGEKAKLEELQIGDYARVTAERSDHGPVAIAIDARSPY